MGAITTESEETKKKKKTLGLIIFNKTGNFECNEQISRQIPDNKFKSGSDKALKQSQSF